MGSKTLYRRTALTAVLLAATAATGCGPDDNSSVEGLAVDDLTPDAIARAAEEVASGRMEMIAEMDSGRTEISGRFDGEDMETEGYIVGPGDAPVTTGRSISVDGRVFVPADMLEVGESPDDPGDVRWIEAPASPNSELPGGAGSESEFFDDPFGTMLDAMGDAAVGARLEELEGGGVRRYTADLAGDEAVNLADRLGFISPVLPQVETDDRGVAVEQYREEHTEAEVTAVVDQNGALREISATIVVDTDDFESCALLPDAGTFSVRMWDLGQPQSIEAPPADQVVPAEEMITPTTWQEPAATPAEPNSAESSAPVGATPSTTVLGGPDDTFESVDGVPVDPSKVMEVPEDELFAGCPT